MELQEEIRDSYILDAGVFRKQRALYDALAGGPSDGFQSIRSNAKIPRLS